MDNNFDTIVAIITPIATSSVGIIRISGDMSLKIASEIFSKKIIQKQINYGFIKNNDEIIDEVILLYFKAPKSYTGEDVIEIQCHGNPSILNTVLELILQKGARPANRGEFTKRAFLNHRIDLTQAESVLDIIHAKTQKSSSDALSNLGGYLKNKINEIKKDLIELYSRLIASIDFPEDVSDVDTEYVVSICNDKILQIDEILNNAKSHDFIKDGFSISLIGAPNVGTSSLFNALLSYNRAIVTDVEGTTRDTIKECINLDGFLLNFIDTAGIRDKSKADKVEVIGIENSISSLNSSDIVLFLFEHDLSEIPFELDKLNKPYLLIRTKYDLNSYENQENIIDISSTTNFGLDKLKAEILKIIRNLIPNDTNYTTNKRQQTCLLRAKEALTCALQTTNDLNITDLIAQDIKLALLALDEITGEVLTDKILDNIFDNFCIGK